MALHFDYEIRWKNYRPFEDTGWLRIKPLTILIGPNNVGKTSVIAPLLLMAQSYLSRDSRAPLITRGVLADVGRFKDIVHQHRVNEDIFFGLKYHAHQARRKLGPVTNYPPGIAEITLSRGTDGSDMLLKKLALYDIYDRPYLSRTRTPKGQYRLDGMDRSKLTAREIAALKRSRPVNFLFSPAAELHHFTQTKKPDSKSIGNPSKEFSNYLAAISYAFQEISGLFRRLSYIGPLRARPRRYYEIAGETPLTVGPRGEHTANLLKRRIREIRRDLNKWIKRFEFGDKMEIEKLSDELFSICFASSQGKTSTNLADAGFGASQVLPLVVQALTASKRSLTIAEQPEIHLNPRLQCVLADLFVEMANRDLRVVVETHSEHLLLRLRRLIADGVIDHSKVAIYYVERTDGISSIRSIPVDADGSIGAGSWPKGFFGETLKESLALAEAQAKARNRRSESNAR